MNKRQIGSSDLHVSDIALGSWLTYGVGIEVDQARRCLDTAFDEGINFIDTANVYGNGAAESFLGDALKERAERQLRLATKVFFPMDSDNRVCHYADREATRCSLTRLRTDASFYRHRYMRIAARETSRHSPPRECSKIANRFSEWPAAISRARPRPSAGSEKFVSTSPNTPLVPTPRRSKARQQGPMAFRRSSGRRSPKAC